MDKNILVLIPVNEKDKLLLEEKAPSSTFSYLNSNTVNVEQVQNTNIVIGNPPIDMIKGSKSLSGYSFQVSEWVNI